ncbi:MAG: phosphatidate cytidylyltransferase [Solirubrobacteraceae bacterium]|nr:phosphatidate cytidylyltransferase [Solirubrobacteraceae bacterium]MDX6675752.1 phosphatidate cytidylyltransferase [Solirubrobacteraceae bacterium]
MARPRGGRRPPPSARRARRRSQRNRSSDLVGRVAVAIPAIVFAIIIVSVGGLVFALGVGALGIVCLAELYGLLDRAHPVKLAGFITMIALVLAAEYGSQFQVLLVAVAALPFLFGLVLVGPRRRGATAAMAATVLGIYWIGLAIAHAVLLRKLLHGDGIIVDVLVGTFLGDTGAYIGGRMFGRRPLAPEISPNKTVEGMLIGMVVAIAAVWFAGLYQDWLSGTDALILGLGVALVAPLGDLFESLIKRDMEAKDTGRLFGPHGGALDRLDAALFTIPVGYYIWVALM